MPFNFRKQESLHAWTECAPGPIALGFMIGDTSMSNGLFWLLVGFALTLALWLAITAYVVISRMTYDRREQQLVDAARRLTDPRVASLPPLQRVPAIRPLLGRRSRRSLYKMSSSGAYPDWLTEVFAAYTVERIGLKRMMLDAEDRNPRHKWRRILAFFTLVRIRAPRVHEVLARAIASKDGDVAKAAAVALNAIGDRGAAEILLVALQRRTLAPSRIATHLDRFPTAIDDLLRPLLNSPETHTRYWAVSLLAQYSDVVGLADDVAPLTDDADPLVRKAALATLGGLAGDIVIPTARRKLYDPVSFVRSTAIRVLARADDSERQRIDRDTIARWIAPALSDPEWEVRLAAKESLVHLAPSTWRVVAAELDSADEFARNGAAEVLQNFGLLDWTIREVSAGGQASTELVEVLKRALHAGGPAMVDAAYARATPAAQPGVERLLHSLRLARATQ